MCSDNRREACTACNSKEVIKWGSFKGVQRFKCKSCEKTFSKNTYKPWSYTKKSIEDWKNYIQLMIDGHSLREISKRTKISLTTCFYWRHKILDGVACLLPENKLNGEVYLDLLSFRENFKGSRTVKKSNYYIKNKVWIINGLDSNEEIKCVPVGVSKFFNGKFVKKFEDEIKKSCDLRTDNNYLVNAYGEEILKGEDEKNESHQRKNFKFRQGLIFYILTMQGVASKYLIDYILWYRHLHKNEVRIVDLINSFEAIKLSSTWKSYKTRKLII